MSGDWLKVRRGETPLIVSIPHAGTDIPEDIEARLVSPDLGRRDTDWWVDRLYAFAADLGATVISTAISRTVIDLNRDPSGAALYPGQAGTALCPTTTSAGEALYREGQAPLQPEIDARRARWFDPYYAAIADEIARLKLSHPAVVLYDAHSIPSRVPRLFDGELPNVNIGTNGGLSCSAGLTAAVEAACAASDFSRVVNGRFKGGWITRSHGQPAEGVHAIQMELACRGYMDEPGDPALWPSAYDDRRAEPMRSALTGVLHACLDFAKAQR